MTPSWSKSLGVTNTPSWPLGTLIMGHAFHIKCWSKVPTATDFCQISMKPHFKQIWCLLAT